MVNVNTEDAIAVKEVNIGNFEGIIVQQSEAVILGVADMYKSNFIVATFIGIDFISATDIAKEFLMVNQGEIQ